MQRLTARLRGRRDGERGAAAVVLTLLMVPMLGFAAAIAVAQDCSRGNCGDMLATAQALIAANDTEGTAGRPVLSSDPLSVTVTGGMPVEHWFAPVIGHDSTRVSATATVGWGGPSRGTALLPLAFSWCSFEKQTRGGIPSTTTLQTIKLTKSAGVASCAGPSGNLVPGGFGFLKTDAGECKVTSSLEENMASSPGESPPSGCDAPDFAAMVGRTVLLPIFDQYGESGSNAWYRVYGYAAFHLTGYQFVGQFKTDGNKVCGPGSNGSDRCVTGYFTRFVELSDAWNYSPDAPQLGSSILRLIR